MTSSTSAANNADKPIIAAPTARYGGMKEEFKTLGSAGSEAFKTIEKPFSALIDRIKGSSQSESASPTPASMSLNGDGKKVAKMLLASGLWTPAQAAGIAGSFMQESGGSAGAENKVSHAYGLGQWLGSRVGDFEKYSGKPLRGSSLEDQVAFFNYEVTRGKERRAGRMLMSATTPEDAARIHAQFYERPGAAEANIERRQLMARNIARGQELIRQTDNRLASTSSAAISNTSNRSLSVATGPINVTTAATDGHGTGVAIGNGLHESLRGTLDAFDDGVAA